MNRAGLSENHRIKRELEGLRKRLGSFVMSWVSTWKLGWFLLCELCSQINSHFVSGSWQRESGGQNISILTWRQLVPGAFVGVFIYFGGVMPCS